MVIAIMTLLKIQQPLEPDLSEDTFATCISTMLDLQISPHHANMIHATCHRVYWPKQRDILCIAWFVHDHVFS